MDNKKESRRLLVLPGSVDPAEAGLLDKATDRIREYGGRFDVLHGDVAEPVRSRYGLVVFLGPLGSRPELDGLHAGPSVLANDAYIVKTTGSNPITVAVAGAGMRGVMYAAYCFADMLNAGAPLQDADVCRSPLISERYAFLSGCAYWKNQFKPGLFYKTLHEMPRHGYNGVIIFPGEGCGTPVGKSELMLSFAENGAIYTDKYIVPEWKTLFANINAYGMGIAVTMVPLVPHGYSDGELEEYYGGGCEPEGYLQALSAYFESAMVTLLETYPEIDMVIFTSVEGLDYGRTKRFFTAPDDLDENGVEAFVENNKKIARAYFKVLNDVCQRYNVKPSFWTHIYGIVSHGLAAMRDVMFEFPEMYNLEDDYWNNNLWVYDLPVMSYLPENYRAAVVEKSKFAMTQCCTDSEYYGAGTLLNAYPDTFYFSAREAVRLGANFFSQRLNHHDRTVSGTLFNTLEIMPFAAARQVWEPADSLDDLWDEWACRRYGIDAAPHVVKALKNSGQFMLLGLQSNGYFFTLHSAIKMDDWDVGRYCFRQFGKPGARLVPKTYDDIVTSKEYSPFQNKTSPVPIGEFRENNARARGLVADSRAHIEKARPYLSAADDAEFTGILDNSDTVLEMILHLGEAAYATNLALDNFDKVDDPAGMKRAALEALERYNETVLKDRDDLLHPPVYNNIKEIIAAYRRV